MNSSFVIGFVFGAAALYMYSDTVRRNVAITNSELELLLANKRELDRLVTEALIRRGITLDEYGNVLR